ncbi:TOBE domain-containing protein, partial [Janthinobacterium sp.]|uniref:TOBE domain-containing protein n=1 Tax=Janthinobacterium sp. TaxID=1871054 RepID=UPI00258ED853
FIACEAVACGPGTVTVRLPGGAVIEVAAQGDAVAPGGRLTLGVRAEHVSLQDGGATGDNAVDVTVSHVEYLGDVAIVYASMPAVAGMPAEMLAVKLPAEDGLRQAGDAMRLHLPPQRCLLFDVAGQALARTFAAPAQPFM